MPLLALVLKLLFLSDEFHAAAVQVQRKVFSLVYVLVAGLAGK